MGTHVTPKTYPALCAAFALIETDNGGHLIGTVYPGERISLTFFDIPDTFLSSIGPAEKVLRQMQAGEADHFNDFIVGEESTSEAIGVMYGPSPEAKRNVAHARKLLESYFNGWEPDYDPSL